MRPNILLTATMALALAGGICAPNAALAAEPADEVAALSTTTATSASASNGTATVTIESVTAHPGQTVQISVSVDSTVNLSGAHLAFTYDPSVITVTNVQAAGFLADAADLKFHHRVLPTGEAQVLWSIPQKQGIVANGTMCMLEAETVSTAANGSSTAITASIVGGGIFDSDVNIVSPTFVNGRASINFLLGDVNNNGVVNVVDTQCIYDMVIGTYGQSSKGYPTFPLPEGWSTSTLLRLADVNEDGEVNVLDARAAQVKALEG